MKTDVEIKVPAKVTRTPARVKKVTRVSCDICGKSVDLSLDNHYGSGMSKCCLCDRDICRNGIKGGQSWPKTCYNDRPDDHGDYPRKLCIICLPLYEGPMNLLQRKHEKEEEALEARIKQESLTKKVTNNEGDRE